MTINEGLDEAHHPGKKFGPRQNLQYASMTMNQTEEKKLGN